MPALLLLCVGGCANYHQVGPEAWWHETIGGKIAAQRPPPPGANEPFPNLATVPPRPPPVNTAEWNQMTAGLIVDRMRADQAAAVAPIPPATVPAGTGTLGTQAPGAQTQAAGASASLVGATAPPPGSAQTAAGAPAASGAATSPPATNQPSPTPSHPGRAAAAPLPELSPAAATPGPFSTASAAEQVANGQLPPLPIEAPPRPGIAPPPPPPAVPITATPPIVAPRPAGTIIDFSLGSAALNDPALADVKAVAAIRGDSGVAITGYGDAMSSDPLAQSDAVALGMARAQALATALVAQGVPYARLRLNAESAGRGASLRLLQ